MLLYYALLHTIFSLQLCFFSVIARPVERMDRNCPSNLIPTYSRFMSVLHAYKVMEKSITPIPGNGHAYQKAVLASHSIPPTSTFLDDYSATLQSLYPLSTECLLSLSPKSDSRTPQHESTIPPVPTMPRPFCHYPRMCSNFRATNGPFVSRIAGNEKMWQSSHALLLIGGLVFVFLGLRVAAEAYLGDFLDRFFDRRRNREILQNCQY